MELSHWLAYAGVALISILSPGPAILLAVSNSVGYGWRRTAWSSLGNVIGILVISGVTMGGLGALLQSSELLFSVLKTLGAGYLIYLGIRQARSKNSVFAQGEGKAPAVSRSNRQLFLDGLTLAISNPKAILFFTALFPQFLDHHAALAPQFAILTGTFMVFSFCSLMAYAAAARGTRGWFRSQRNVVAFNRSCGGLFIALGAGLLTLRRN
ncbi:LysE family translocator [Massilia endophytica]|uniref:LysE family translocator n=1 Tax=Massilia endophytica TaxID=2899220 RepID=UPI001E6559D8|nr:LysE family translocator [Massilia endophytica]UGQ47427.1 LysE family translocator [Massilia endophytica]